MKIDFNVLDNLSSYAQAVTEIAMAARYVIDKRGYYNYNSLDLNEAIADWALDFEKARQTFGFTDDYDADYFTMIDTYASEKLEAFFENVPCMKPEPKTKNGPKTGVWLRLGVRLDVADEQAGTLMSGCEYGKTIIRQAIQNGDFKLDGETYIPASVIKERYKGDISYPFIADEDVTYNF